MACLHKGLEVEIIPMRFCEKEKIKFSSSDRVPVLVDGDNVISDSFEIARYLERAYPSAPSLFGGQGGEAGCLFVNAYSDAIIKHYYPLIMLDIWQRLDNDSAAYFREKREETLANTLENLQGARETEVKSFRNSLQPVRNVLKKQPFVGGQTANYSDFILVSEFLTSKATSPFHMLEAADPVEAYYDRVLQTFDSRLLRDCVFES